MSATSRDEPWSINELSGQVEGWVRKLGEVWVTGEVTKAQIRGNGRLSFMNVRDLDRKESLQVTAADGVIPRDLEPGTAVVMYGKPQYWKSNGSMSFRIKEIHTLGEGALAAQLAALENQLEKEGLFHPRHKVTLPHIPHRIGLITAAGSDAERDVINVAKDRWPGVTFQTFSVPVQGKSTVREVKRGLALLDETPGVDVIICTRGGGSKEDLLPWSDESLVRAAFACNTPVVSAIGHEKDSPLLDRVADLRAATPTDAAKRVVPDQKRELAALERVIGDIERSAHDSITIRETAVKMNAERIELKALEIINRAEVAVSNARHRVENLAQWQLDTEQNKLASISQLLVAVDVQKTLERGYALMRTADGKIANHPEDGTLLKVTTFDDEYTVIVKRG